MLAAFCSLALAAAAGAQAAAPAAQDPCAGDPSCTQASAGDLFAAADALAGEGDLAGAETLLQALTEDPDAELRAEARFRLAAVREKAGNLPGAVAALRELLAERPDAQRARLELGRILALQGNMSEARRELERAEEAGLPADVAITVRRFSTALQSQQRRGGSIELTFAADTNVNRATSDRFVNTVIAPFELDADARRQSGPALAIGGEAWSRDRIFGATLLSRAGFHADLFPGNARFNDVQLLLNSGPEIGTRLGRIRPALTYERRWYGGDAYSSGIGGALNWAVLQSANSYLQLDASVVRQSIRRNAVLDGHRYGVSATYDRSFDEATSTRVSLRWSALDAAVRPESLRQFGGDLLVARRLGEGTVFAQGGYTWTGARAPLALFGKTRRDDRIDLTIGLIADRIKIAGFSPVMRVIYTNSRSNLELYDFTRTRAELGLSRRF